MPSPTAILIAGPTASGKSALALELAERLNGAIINADSMQVYRDLRVLTARPAVEEEARLPHRMYGHVDAAHAYSAGRYAADAERAFAAVCSEGRLPIFVGGTGLYFQVLLEGLSPVPDIPQAIRSRWRDEAADTPADALHRRLRDTDPEMAARLAPTDRQRIVRALEVVEATGCSLADWQAQPGTPLIDAKDAAKLVIAPPRAILHERANTRFAAMWDAGAVDEVRGLLARDLDPGLPAMRALGVGAIQAWLSGACAREAALEKGQTETRRYIKRQLTWLRKNMIAWKWISTQQMERKISESLIFIDP